MVHVEGEQQTLFGNLAHYSLPDGLNQDGKKRCRNKRRGKLERDDLCVFIETRGVVTAREIANGTATSTTVAASNDR